MGLWRVSDWWWEIKSVDLWRLFDWWWGIKSISGDCYNGQNSTQNRISNSIENCMEISIIFARLWVSFWKPFGSIVVFKSRFKFDHDFGMLFCRSPERGVISVRLRRIVDGSSGAADPPRRRPFRAEGSYKRLAQASQTRSNTQRARGPANFFSEFE